MNNDTKPGDQPSKQSEDDKRWKHQDEFDSTGTQQLSEDENTNAVISQSDDKGQDADGKPDDATLKRNSEK